MSAAGETRRLRRAGSTVFASLRAVAAQPRFHVYLACTVVTVLASFLLGKEMIWDTMDYHVYAGFSALHDRFGQDYFAAGPQGYFNPYAYVPFYLLIRSSLTPLADASILALLQSAILWLTYELAMTMVPRAEPKARVRVGILAAAFAFANPILINELGSSFIDVTTAEIVLAGWLLLVAAVRAPNAVKIACGALLLGAASALKPTNTVHTVAAATVLMFIPGRWHRKLRYAGLFAACVGTSFVLVNLPWSIHLERHFGNPVFPLLNGLFRSPEFSAASMLDYRFIPATFDAALMRPFAMLAPDPMVQYELAAPDVRYAVLSVVVLALLARWAWRLTNRRTNAAPSSQQGPPSRALVALGCGFLVDWILWLTASGNGRYFIPMACVAGALCVVLVLRLLSAWPKLRNYTLAAIFMVQLIGVFVGSGYRPHLPWTNGPWFAVSVPASLTSRPHLFLMLGGQTNSFIIPDMPRTSGFVNLDGGYKLLGPDGPNGRRVESLIRRYAPHVRVVVRDRLSNADQASTLPDAQVVGDTLGPFGLKVEPDQCAKIVARGVMIPYRIGIGARGANRPHVPESHTEYLLACRVVRVPVDQVLQLSARHAADLAFDHLEESCPALFAPPQPGDRIMGDRRDGYFLAREYPDTGVVAWITHGIVRFQKIDSGREHDAGSERMWQIGVRRVACGRRGTGFLRVLGE